MTLITIEPGETRQVTYAAAAGSVQPVQQYLIANIDETATLYVGPADAGHQQPDLAAPGAASQLVALQSIVVGATRDWYVYNPSGGIFANVFSNTFTGAPVTIDVIPDCHYWAPSPYQQALSLVDQGLMKDSTGQSIVTQTTSTVTNTGNALTQGVPPGVPNIKSFAKVNGNASGSPFTLGTFSGNSRIWGVSLSLAAATDNSTYVAGLSRVYAQVKLGSGTALTVAELALSVQSQTTTDHCDFNFNGLPANSGDTVVLDTNNGGTLTGATIVASCVVLYSTP